MRRSLALLVAGLSLVAGCSTETTATLDNRFMRRPGPGEIHYSALLGGVHGREGEVIEQECVPAGSVLQAIQVNIGEKPRLLRGVRCRFQTQAGAVEERVFGHDDGNWQDWYEVPAGVSLLGISGATGWYVDSFQLVFDDGSVTPVYGGGGGDTRFDLRLNKDPGAEGGRIRGFYGTLDRVGLETIGLVFDPAD
ncbi:MAG: hypothetical protein R2834_01895 [Rhodothermales bacterium]